MPGAILWKMEQPWHQSHNEGPDNIMCVNANQYRNTARTATSLQSSFNSGVSLLWRILILLWPVAEFIETALDYIQVSPGQLFFRAAVVMLCFLNL